MNPIAANLQNVYILYMIKTLWELKALYDRLKEVYICENNDVKPYSLTESSWIADKLMVLDSFIDKLQGLCSTY